jgi:hypothetical protein
MTAQYKWPPSEPTDEMMSVFTPLESYRNTVIKDGYKALWQVAPTQVDQTALINQLTDELNKTEAERVKWMTMALSSKPPHGTTQATWVRFDPNDETTWPPLDSGSGIRSIRVITNGGDICEFIHTSKQWIYLLNYEIDKVTHWARLPVFIK